MLTQYIVIMAAHRGRGGHIYMSETRHEKVTGYCLMPINYLSASKF
jgi:hypothetical protein